MKDRRAVYREALGPHYTVIARFSDRVATGVAVDVSVAGVGATFHAGEEARSLLPDVGELGELTISSDYSENPVMFEARVAHRAEPGGDLCVLGFEFTAIPKDMDPKLKSLFNRRSEKRTRPPADQPVEVLITAGTGSEVKGTLVDISSVGAAVEAPLRSQRVLGSARAVDLSLVPGPHTRHLRIPAIIRNWRDDQSNVVFGLAFAVPTAEPELRERIDSYLAHLQQQTLSSPAV